MYKDTGLINCIGSLSSALFHLLNMDKLVLVLVTVLGFVSSLPEEPKLAVKAHPGRKVVCYFGSWAVYRPEAGRFDVETIDPFLCTHLIFSFTGLRNGVVTVLDPYNDVCEEWGQGALKRFSKLKSQNPKLRTLVAIGGWNEGSARYSDMAKTPESRKIFIDSVVKMLERFDFDGFDLDWEYPANRGGAPEDKKNFGLLVKEMRTEFDNYGYILSAAVSAGEPTIKTAYDVPTIASYLDFINVMAYDFHGAWDMTTGHHSPMYKSPLDKGTFETYNVNHSIHFWISEGAPREKLILGMGSYGRGVILDKETDNGIYSPGSQALPPGPYTREPGYWGYNEICEFMLQDNWTYVLDENYKAPYAYRGRLWVGFDDVKSIQYKSEYIMKNGLGGGMVWSLETDDFQGKCHGERFPLIKTIYRTVIGKYPKYEWEPKPPRSTSKALCRPEPSATTPTPSDPVAVAVPVTDSSKPGKVTPAPNEICKAEGFFPDSEDCTKFIRCVSVEDKWTVYKYDCGAGTVFSPKLTLCVLPDHESAPKCNRNVLSVSYNRQGPL